MTVRLTHGDASPRDRARGLLRVYHLWAAAWVLLALTIYASLVPFSFEQRPPIRSLGGAAAFAWQFITAVHWSRWPITEVSSLGNSNRLIDWIVNLALYMLPAALLRLHAGQRGLRPGRSWAGSVLTVFCVSWLVECVQAMMVPHDRNVALQDVLANTAGAAVAALSAPTLAQQLYRLVVAVYRPCAHAAHRLGEFVERQRDRPLLVVLVACVHLALVLAWWSGHTLPGQEKFAPHNNLLPFARQLDRSYDVAAIHLGRSFVVYCLLAALLSLQFFSLRDRRKLGLLVLTLALLAFVHEMIRHHRTGIGVDITQPLLAIMAAGLLFCVAVLLVHAVRVSCRRRNAVPVTHERRRRTHRYE